MQKSSKKSLSVNGFDIFQALLRRQECALLAGDIRKIACVAPMVRPTTPSGKRMSVRMMSAGCVGWGAGMSGNRYVTHQPSGASWPPIPAGLLDVWQAVSGVSRHPDCCLINYYGQNARMGLHQDKDEGNFDWPVVSVSLGDDALFRIGNADRGGKTSSLWLKSGDVVVMGGRARLAYHGVDRIRFGSSSLLPKGGRLNLTLRVVDPLP